MSRNIKVRLNQIIVLLKVLKESKLFTKENVRKKYLVAETQFEEPLSFLKNLKIIKEDHSELSFYQKYKILNNLQRDKLIKLLVNVLFKTKNIYSGEICNYFKRFRLINTELEFRPNINQRLAFSNIRNFLIELGVSRFDEQDRYLVSKTYKDLILNLNLKFKTSLAKLDKYLLSDKIIGSKAEIFVIRYEKNRLRNIPNLVNNIEYTSLIDVSAGYDIKSFIQVKKDHYSEIYIEVKAVSSFDWSFNWSDNEIETARLLGEKYFLYLLPVEPNGGFKKNSLTMIKNPYKKIYKNRSWERKSKIILFTPPEIFTRQLKT